MPIYEFECKECPDEFEFQLRASDKTPVCPTCKSDSLVKRPVLFGVKNTGKTKSGSSSSSLASQCTVEKSVGNKDGHNHSEHHNQGDCRANQADKLLKKYDKLL